MCDGYLHAIESQKSSTIMRTTLSLAATLFFLFQSCDQASEINLGSPPPDGLRKEAREGTGTSHIVFRSSDQGKTWQDISDGLPALIEDSFSGGRRVFFADENGLWLTDGKGIYNTKPGVAAPYWTRAAFPNERSSIAPGKNGIYAFHHLSGIFQKTIGTSDWKPVFTEFKDKKVRGVVETPDGSIFISSDKGLFRTEDHGKTWKNLPAGGLGGKIVGENGVLLTTGSSGIMRSIDGGNNWNWVIREGGVGIDVTNIKGGFAAIHYSVATKTRRVTASYDGGKSWEPIDAGLPAQLSISSIVQLGDDLYCGHPDGVFKSADKGKTWKRVLSAVDGKVYHLTVSGNVLYAIPRVAGC